MVEPIDIMQIAADRVVDAKRRPVTKSAILQCRMAAFDLIAAKELAAALMLDALHSSPLWRDYGSSVSQTP